MIIRILGEGQRNVSQEHLQDLNELDEALSEALKTGDEAGFDRLLATMLQRVRTVGAALPNDALSISESILPAEGSSLIDVLDLLGEQGLIPG